MGTSAIERSTANTHIVISEKDLATCTKVLRQLLETHEGAFSTRARMHEEGFAPPLDEIDGAARIYDLIGQGLAGSLLSG